MKSAFVFCLAIVSSCSPDRKTVEQGKSDDDDWTYSFQAATKLYTGVGVVVSDSIWPSAGTLSNEELVIGGGNEGGKEIEAYPAAKLSQGEEQNVLLEYVGSHYDRLAEMYDNNYAYIAIPDPGKIVLNREYILPHPDVQVRTLNMNSLVYYECKLFAGKITFTALSRDSAYARIMVVSETQTYTHLKAIGKDSAYMRSAAEKEPLLDTIMADAFSFVRKRPLMK